MGGLGERKKGDIGASTEELETDRRRIALVRNSLGSIRPRKRD
jgi:hypothetical protein